MTIRTATTAAILAAAVIVAGVACSGDARDQEDDSASATINVTARDTLFEPSQLRARKGESITLELMNVDPTEHDLEIAEIDAEVTAGGASDDEHGGGHEQSQTVAVHTDADETASVTFTPNSSGEYDFYCTIRGHKEAGMVGTLIVE